MKWFCKHNWSKWSKALPNYGNNATQVRECLKCGKIKTRTIWVSQLNGNDAVLINQLLDLTAKQGVTND